MRGRTARNISETPKGQVPKEAPFGTSVTPSLGDPPIFHDPEPGTPSCWLNWKPTRNIRDIPEPVVPKVPKLPELWITWAEWKAGEINRIFAEHGTNGPGRITAATVEDGLEKTSRAGGSDE
jgi:hypothetical protein